MNLAMVTAAQWYGDFIAHLPSERRALGEAHMVGVRRFAAADQAPLPGNEPDVLAVANSPRLGEDKHALVDGFGAALANRPEGIAGGRPDSDAAASLTARQIAASVLAHWHLWRTRQGCFSEAHRNGLVIVTPSTSRP
jgi:hypothetical protein